MLFVIRYTSLQDEIEFLHICEILFVDDQLQAEISLISCMMEFSHQ